jgi:hypothetical protein
VGPLLCFFRGTILPSSRASRHVVSEEMLLGPEAFSFLPRIVQEVRCETTVPVDLVSYSIGSVQDWRQQSASSTVTTLNSKLIITLDIHLFLIYSEDHHHQTVYSLLRTNRTYALFRPCPT